MREVGVTGPQARLLLNLHRRPGENQGFYAEQLEVEPITLCRMVDRLEEAGMVERRRDPADRRAWQLHLTAKSQKLVAKLQQSVDSLVDDMLCGLTSEERAEFARLLKAVGTNLSERRDVARISNG
ncbi:MAG: MarR family winged helix-turn-helix transcriptional regulator [Croceibacterium sp.]